MEPQQPEFDAEATLKKIRDDLKIRRHVRTWSKSKLNFHRAEIVKLNIAGASLAEICHWLKQEKKIKAARSTVLRFISTLPELAKTEDSNNV